MSDFSPGAVLDFKFRTSVSGAGTTLAGTPIVSVYKDNSTTQSTAGITLSVDFDGITGCHNVRVDTSADGTFYAASSSFSVVVTTGTVSGTSIAGHVVDSFTLRRAALPVAPTDWLTAAAVKADAATKIANETEAQIIDDTDSEKVLKAITDKIASVNPSLGDLTLSAIGTAVWANATRTLTGLVNVSKWGGVDVTGMPMPTYVQPTGFLSANFATMGGGTDWTSDERTAIRAILGVPSFGSTPAVPDSGVLSSIKSKVDLIVSSSDLASAVNNSLTSSHGTGSWQQSVGSGLSGPSSVTVRFRDNFGNPVPMVDFTVMFQGVARTDGSGVSSFGLADGAYTVVARATNGVIFPNATLTVSGTTALVIVGASAIVNYPVVYPSANNQSSW